MVYVKGRGLLCGQDGACALRLVERRAPNQVEPPAAHEVKLATARREYDQMASQAKQDKAALEQAHAQAFAELKAAHEQELEVMSDGARRAADAHRTALAELQAKYEAEIASEDIVKPCDSGSDLEIHF